MCPLIEMRHYSRWVVTYLGKLTAVHAESIENDSGEFLGEICDNYHCSPLIFFKNPDVLKLGVSGYVNGKACMTLNTVEL